MVDVDVILYAGHETRVNNLLSLSNGNVASTDRDGVIHIWDPASPDMTLARCTGHTRTVAGLAQFDDGRIVSAGTDNVVHIWDPADPATTIFTNNWQQWVSQSPIRSVAALSGGRVGTTTDLMVIWDPRRTYAENAVDFYETDACGQTLLELGDQRVLVAEVFGAVHVYTGGTTSYSTRNTYVGHESVVYAMVELDDGRVASASADGTVQVWDPGAVDTTLATYTGHEGQVRALALLPNGLLASASTDGTGPGMES